LNIERNETNDMKQAGFYFFANHMNDPIVESLDAGKARRVALRCVALRCVAVAVAVAVESILFQR
jgi:hypothetical protein